MSERDCLNRGFSGWNDKTIMPSVFRISKSRAILSSGASAVLAVLAVLTMYERAKKTLAPLIFRPCPAKLPPPPPTPPPPPPTTLNAHAINIRQLVILGIIPPPHGSGSSVQIVFEGVHLHLGFGFGGDADEESIIWRGFKIILLLPSPSRC